MSLAHLLYHEEQQRNGYTDMDLLAVMQQQLLDYYERTRTAAIRIQRRWRGYSDRKYLLLLNVQATKIQRIFRGFQARKRVRLLRAERRNALERDYLVSMAVKIQKCWRGHHSRSEYSDYYRRRQYLASVTETGRELAASISSRASMLSSIQRSAAAASRASTLSQLLRQTHHLLSTAAIPGVWRSRWGDEYEARVGGVSVEDRVRQEWTSRQRELRAEREEQRREQRRERKRRDQAALMVDMIIGVDNDAETEAATAAAEEEEKTQTTLDAPSRQQEEEEAEREDEGQVEAWVRFPPIHSHRKSAASYAENQSEMAVDGSDDDVAPSREWPPVRVEQARPKSRKGKQRADGDMQQQQQQ